MQKYKVALLTNTLNKPGGAEYVTIAMYRSLREIKDLRVNILGRERNVNVNALSRWLEPSIAYELSKDYIYMYRFPLNLLKFKDYDLIVNTRSNEVLAPADVHYLHWIFSPYGVKDPEALTYYRISYGIGDNVLEYSVRHAFHFMQLKTSRLILANSRYVASLLKDLGINAIVLYPPVRSREITQSIIGSEWRNKENIVITTTRIAPGKQLETIPLIASKVKDAKFILVGLLQDKNYYTKLLQLKKTFSSDNFIIIPNVDKRELYKLLSKALIYFHTARHEQFGIAVVEAMAAGAIPLVHRSGGPWQDILEEREGYYGYSYNSINEAVQILKDIISNKHAYEDIIERARFRALIFDEQLFKVSFRKIIKSLIIKT
jgi:glycosyltransferase involved in cell wall biosynthesis